MILYKKKNFGVCEVKSMLREMDLHQTNGGKNLLAQLGIEPRSSPLCL